MSETLKIVTNHQPRNVIYWWELTNKERAEFIDYLDTEDKQSEASFVRYRSWTYDLNEFMLPPEPLRALGWQGFHSDSYFSGIAIKYPADDYEHVICALVLKSNSPRSTPKPRPANSRSAKASK